MWNSPNVSQTEGDSVMMPSQWGLGPANRQKLETTYTPYGNEVQVPI